MILKVVIDVKQQYKIMVLKLNLFDHFLSYLF